MSFFGDALDFFNPNTYIDRLKKANDPNPPDTRPLSGQRTDPNYQSEEERKADDSKLVWDPNSAYEQRTETDRAEAKRLQDFYQNRQAPQMAGVSIGPNERAAGTQLDERQAAQARGFQTDALNRLRARAMGTGGPSVAELQLRGTTGENVDRLAGMAASQRGGFHGGSDLASLLQAQTNLQSSAQGQAALLRAQEQTAAEGALGSLATGQRTQDLGAATTNSQLGQQNQQFNAGQTNQRNVQQGQLDWNTGNRNLGAKLDTMTADDAAVKGFYGAGTTLDQQKAQRAFDEMNARRDKGFDWEKKKKEGQFTEKDAVSGVTDLAKGYAGG